MKFLIAAVLFMIVSQSVSAQSIDASLRTKCTFFADRLILNCTGPSGRVECDAADEFPFKVKIVGISFPKTKSPIKKFSLHPLKSDNTAWLESSFVFNERPVTFSIYQSPMIKDFGFRLKDATCFERLATLFESSKANLIVPSTTEFKSVKLTEKPKTRVELFAEIFWFEKTMTKSVKTSKV